VDSNRSKEFSASVFTIKVIRKNVQQNYIGKMRRNMKNQEKTKVEKRIEVQN